MMRSTILASIAILALTCPGRAEAGMITFTESAMMNGSLGGTPFSTTLTFTMQADTSNVVDNGGGNFSVVPSFGKVSLASSGGATFTDNLAVLLFKGDMNDPGGYFELLDTIVGIEVLTAYGIGSGFSEVSLTSPFGPISGSTAYANSMPSFMTSAGILQLTGATGLTTVNASVPEPSSLVLTGIAGVFSLAFVLYRRKQTELCT